MLRAIQNNWHKSKAATIIQTGIENAPLGRAIPNGPAKMANALVERIWDVAPQFVDGTNGPRPNPPGVAVFALALGTEEIKGVRQLERQILQFVLIGLVEELTVNRYKYSLNGTDEYLISIAQQSLAEQFEAGESDRSEVPTDAPQSSAHIDAEMKQHGSDLDARIKAARERR